MEQPAYHLTNDTTVALKKRLEQAIQEREVKANKLEQELGLQNEKTIDAWSHLAWIHEKKGDIVQALTYLEKAFYGAQNGLGVEYPKTKELVPWLESLCEAQGMRSGKDCLDARRQLWKYYTARSGPSDIQTLAAQNKVLLSLMDKKDYEEASAVGENLIRMFDESGISHGRMSVAIRHKVAKAHGYLGERAGSKQIGENQRAVALLEDVLVKYESTVPNRQFAFYALRDLRNHYIRLEDSPKAIDRGRRANELFVSLLTAEKNTEYATSRSQNLRDRLVADLDDLPEAAPAACLDEIKETK
jgi:tetratricopeptide (TPR) repeat protein